MSSGRRRKVKLPPPVYAPSPNPEVDKCYWIQNRKLIKQRKAIDCFACHHCHFKSSWGFDGWQPAARWRTLFLFTSLICHLLPSVTASPVLSQARPAGSLYSLWIISNCCLPRAGLEFRRAAVVLLSDFHPAFSETFWASLTWTYECLIVVYIYRLLSHDQFTAMCPLIWDNVVDESVQEYFNGNACRGIAAIECCVIVSDAWVDYIPN